MKSRRNILVGLAVLVIALGAWAINFNLHRLSQVDEPILIEDLPNDSTASDSMTGLLLSKENAMQLATEQINVNEYTLSIAELKEIDGERYYLIDVVNKSGPSFGTQLAVNERSGDVLAYDPANQELMSMTKFPIETPLAQVQDWNGIFVPVEGESISEGISIELLQADQNSFEFTVWSTQKERLLQGVAKVDGSKAHFQSQEDFILSFVKDGKSLSISERGKKPLAEQKIVIAGKYTLQME